MLVLCGQLTDECTWAPRNERTTYGLLALCALLIQRSSNAGEGNLVNVEEIAEREKGEQGIVEMV